VIGKLIGAAVGAKAAKSVRGGLGGPGGALLGAGAVAVVRRLSPMAVLAAAAGGYVAKRYYDRRGKSQGKQPT
jgi:hypothetical protein